MYYRVKTRASIFGSPTRVHSKQTERWPSIVPSLNPDQLCNWACVIAHKMRTTRIVLLTESGGIGLSVAVIRGIHGLSCPQRNSVVISQIAKRRKPVLRPRKHDWLSRADSKNHASFCLEETKRQRRYFRGVVCTSNSMESTAVYTYI